MADINITLDDRHNIVEVTLEREEPVINVEVIGMAFVMETATPTRKRVQGAKSLMTLEITGGDEPEAIVRPASWLAEGQA